MLMTPITPNVIARPIATSTSTDRGSGRRTAFRCPSRTSARRSMRRTASAAAAPDARRRSRRSCRRRTARAAPPAGCALRAGARATGRNRVAGAPSPIAAVERRQRQAGFDLLLDAACRFRRRPAARSSAMARLVERRSISCTASSRTAGSGLDSSKRATVVLQHPPQPVVGADLGQLVSRREPAAFERHRIDQLERRRALVGRLHDEDLPILDAGQYSRSSSRAARTGRALACPVRRAARRSSPCPRSWPRAVRRACARNASSADWADAGAPGRRGWRAAARAASHAEPTRSASSIGPAGANPIRSGRRHL